MTTRTGHELAVLDLFLGPFGMNAVAADYKAEARRQVTARARYAGRSYFVSAQRDGIHWEYRDRLDKSLEDPADTAGVIPWRRINEAIHAAARPGQLEALAAAVAASQTFGRRIFEVHMPRLPRFCNECINGERARLMRAVIEAAAAIRTGLSEWHAPTQQLDLFDVIGAAA